ncbi:hypothetical protein [Sedimentibacter sp. MB31-C6]|uniref:hypothetical protein n=1 Tax=Sedimentibacter sp. MB31-C6 TaxID=3109366 RepID=UPI002DDCD365|nr:hypothetical protein [Sedimentibacter sp. MB36-C1]WSI04642.1 hypothetical protein U8307_02330 [Sedimentibacter sp. MB36-C1]
MPLASYEFIYPAKHKLVGAAKIVIVGIVGSGHSSLNMVKKCGFVQNGYRQYEDTGFVDEPYFEINLD